MAIRCSVFSYHKICVFVQIARNCSNTLLVTQTDINGEMFLHGSLSLLCSNSTTCSLCVSYMNFQQKGTSKPQLFKASNNTVGKSANQLPQAIWEYGKYMGHIGISSLFLLPSSSTELIAETRNVSCNCCVQNCQIVHCLGPKILDPKGQKAKKTGPVREDNTNTF